jgi:hypothetical protein
MKAQAWTRTRRQCHIDSGARRQGINSHGHHSQANLRRRRDLRLSRRYGISIRSVRSNIPTPQARAPIVESSPGKPPACSEDSCRDGGERERGRCIQAEKDGPPHFPLPIFPTLTHTTEGNDSPVHVVRSHHRARRRPQHDRRCGEEPYHSDPRCSLRAAPEVYGALAEGLSGNRNAQEQRDGVGDLRQHEPGSAPGSISTSTAEAWHRPNTSPT